MLYNFLEDTEIREVTLSSFNSHIKSNHPDRVMKQHDLIYISEGTWNISQDGIDYEVNKGDVILLQADHHHCGTKPCENTVKTCFVHFKKFRKDDIGSEKAEENYFSFPMVIHCQNKPMVEHYFHKIIYAYWSESEYAVKKASAYLHLLLCELSEKNETTKNTDIAENIKLYIKKNSHRFIKIDELAGNYNCSARTISDKFKSSVGLSIHTWQIKFKCKMADELIKSEPDITLKEVAATFGFYDEYHFSKCYKKIYGHSPKRNREDKI